MPEGKPILTAVESITHLLEGVEYNSQCGVGAHPDDISAIRHYLAEIKKEAHRIERGDCPDHCQQVYPDHWHGPL